MTKIKGIMYLEPDTFFDKAILGHVLYDTEQYQNLNFFLGAEFHEKCVYSYEKTMKSIMTWLEVTDTEIAEDWFWKNTNCLPKKGAPFFVYEKSEEECLQIYKENYSRAVLGENKYFGFFDIICEDVAIWTEYSKGEKEAFMETMTELVLVETSKGLLVDQKEPTFLIDFEKFVNMLILLPITVMGVDYYTDKENHLGFDFMYKYFLKVLEENLEKKDKKVLAAFKGFKNSNVFKDKVSLLRTLWKEDKYFEKNATNVNFPEIKNAFENLIKNQEKVLMANAFGTEWLKFKSTHPDFEQILKTTFETFCEKMGWNEKSDFSKISELLGISSGGRQDLIGNFDTVLDPDIKLPLLFFTSAKKG
jgi:hypothetical protein